MLACKRANEEITKELMAKGADVHATNNVRSDLLLWLFLPRLTKI